MKVKIFFASALAFMGGISAIDAQEKKQMDKNAILDMCGCYEVSFKYTETFAPKEDYEKSKDYTASALELALPILDEENRVSIQHLLVINDSMVIKHWRQDWIYENRMVFDYDKDNSWVNKELPADAVKGQWTQKVYQVDDGPRYSGSATWVHYDGKHFWENKANSPLPRREYTKRDDYNVMLRGNRHEITDTGWNHEQDNDKIIRKVGEEDVLLAQEKGLNTYTRVADENCQLARDWWEENRNFWKDVRAAWSAVYHKKGTMTLLKEVDDKPFYKHLAALKANGAGKEEVAKLLEEFIVFSPAPEEEPSK